VIGGSSGIGLETARRARDDGARVIITGRDPERVHAAGRELGASIAAFDATDPDRLAVFFDELPAPIDHVLLAGPGARHVPLAKFDVEEARRELDARLLLPLLVARETANTVRPDGSLILIGCTDDRLAEQGPTFTSALNSALAEMTSGLAHELAPIRVNMLAAGSIHTPADVAELALHLFTGTAITGAIVEIGRGPRSLAR